MRRLNQGAYLLNVGPFQRSFERPVATDFYKSIKKAQRVNVSILAGKVWGRPVAALYPICKARDPHGPRVMEEKGAEDEVGE